MKETALYLVVKQMVDKAAEEIGFEICDENVEQVVLDLEHDFDTVLDFNKPVTWQVMSLVVAAVKTWQRNTKNNF